jgi:hypothetical protein
MKSMVMLDLKNAVLGDYTTTLKISGNIYVSSEGPSSRASSLLTLDEGPSLETSSFCLFLIKVVI